MNNSYPGIFIALEGIDRSGKHTQGELLKTYLMKRGFNVLFTPWWGTFKGSDEKLKHIIKRKETAPVSEIQKLFIDYRAKHLAREIIPYLKRSSKNIVICDRYFLSTLAYGPSTGGGTLEELLKMHEAMPEFIFPDLTIIIDISKQEAIKRLNAEADIFEKASILESVRQRYLSLAIMFDNAKTVIIDGARDPQEVFASIKPHVDNLISAKNIQQR